MEYTSYFHGYSLNAVDAKGRVSLPYSFRQVVEARVHPGVPGDQIPASARQVYLSEHSAMPCVQGYDATYSHKLAQDVAQRTEGGLGAIEFASMDTFGAVLAVSYDEPGRMVLSGYHRAMANISNLAWFVGHNDTFTIWAPDVFLDYCGKNGQSPRLMNVLRAMLADKGVAL